MAKEVWLIRHGKAGKSQPGKDDTKRPLTEKGKKEFKAFVPDLKAHLEDGDTVVWTSPLTRAKETAAILTEQLGWEEAEEKEWLANGDFEAFIEDASKVEEDVRIICVGHEPTLSSWAEKLTGEEQPFSKGEAAVFHLDEAESGKGTLLWKQAPGSPRQPSEESVKVKEVLLNQTEEMEKALKDYFNNPYAPETTHQLRVNMRRMRGLLNFLKPLLEEGEYNELNGSLKEAGNRLGPLRETDVLIEEVGKAALEEPDLIDQYPEVFKFLHSERRKRQRSGLSKTTRRLLKDSITETREAIQQLTFGLESQEEWTTFLSKRLEKKTKKLKKAFDTTDHSDHEASHQVRIQAKKVRYAADGFKDWMPKEAKKSEKKAKKLQNKLGVHSDLHTNARLLEDYAEKAKEEPLRQALLALSEYKDAKRDNQTIME